MLRVNNKHYEEVLLRLVMVIQEKNDTDKEIIEEISFLTSIRKNYFQWSKICNQSNQARTFSWGRWKDHSRSYNIVNDLEQSVGQRINI